MNNVNFSNELSINEMQEIQGGGKAAAAPFCNALGAAALGYQVGVLLNWWNPLGWAGEVTLAAGGIYCLVVS